MIKHICDRCGIELENKEQFVSIKLSFFNYNIGFNDFHEQFELCESCASFLYADINNSIKKIKEDE